MAGGTCRQHFSLGSVKRLLHQVFRARNFFAGAILGRPGHIKNLISRSNEFFRVSMTFETPFHLQRRCLKQNRHLIDRAMTRRAANPFVYVNAVIEIGVVWQVMDPDPLNWPPGAEAGAHWFEIRAIGPNLIMATHAGAG